MERRQIGDWIGALSGIAFVALLVASIIIVDPNREGGPPVSPDQASDVLAQTLVAQRDNTRLSAYVGLLSVFSLLWFLAYLQRHLRRAEGEAGWLTSVAYGGGLVFAGVMLVSVGYELAMAVLDDYGTDAQVAKMFVVLTWDHLAVLAGPAAALVGGAAAVGLSHAAFPRWLSWFGMLVMLVLLSPAFVTGALGYFAGLLGFFLWVIAASVVLLRHPREAASPTTAIGSG